MASSLRMRIVITPPITEIQRRIRNLSPLRRRNIINSALIRSALVVVDEARAQMINAKSDDQPPHPTRLTSRSGRGRKSIHATRRVDRTSVSGFTTEVGTNLEYMAVHETGGIATTSGGGLFIYPPRPWLRPGYKKAERRIEAIFRAEWVAGIRRARTR